MVDPKEKNPNDESDVTTETTEESAEEIATEEMNEAAAEEKDTEGE
jgi:hypothetical protein